MELRPSVDAAATTEELFGVRRLDGGPLDWNDDLWADTRNDLVAAPPGADAVTLVIPRIRDEEERRPARAVALREVFVLTAVAALQIALAWRVIGAASAATDQAAMVKAGHQEIAYLLHGRHITRYETVLPGAPVLYPVLAAAVDAVGGAHAVHAANLLFAVLATVGVYCTARRLDGPLAGTFAALLFVALSPTQHLSAAGTYDAPATCLLVWSACFAVRFAFADGRHAVWLTPVLMLAANWTSYLTVLWDPVIFALIAFAGPGYSAWKTSRGWNAQRVALVAGVLAEITLLIGRAPSFTGIRATVMDRAASRATAQIVLMHCAQWLWPVLVPAALGLVVAAWQYQRGTATRAGVAVRATLLAAGLLAPLNQLRWHSLDGSLSHCAISAAFAAVAAGGLLGRCCSAAAGRLLQRQDDEFQRLNTQAE
jgi:hypothetical protein